LIISTAVFLQRNENTVMTSIALKRAEKLEKINRSSSNTCFAKYH